MFTLALLLLVQAAPAQTPVLKVELKEIPAQGATGPLIGAEGTTNLPDGAVLKSYLYYEVVDEGRAVATDISTVNGGKFVQDFVPFPGSPKLFPGKYIARFSYNPGFQNLTIAGFDATTIDAAVSVGTAQDLDRESKLVRTRLVREIQEILALGEEVNLKIEQLKGKPASDWSSLLKTWTRKTADIQGRSHPEKVREFRVLHLDLIADSGLENLSNILNSAARYAAAGKAGDAREGLTRLRQTADYWIAEISSPKLASPAEFRSAIEAAKALIAETLRHPEAPVPPARRRFIEINSLLQRSLPDEFQQQVLDLGSRSTAFFNAVSDKDPRAGQLHAELDRLLDQLEAPFRPPK